MLELIARCDICQKELPVEYKDTILGTVPVVKSYKTKEWSTDHCFDHLCETCALKLDNLILSTRIEVLEGR